MSVGGNVLVVEHTIINKLNRPLQAAPEVRPFAALTGSFAAAPVDWRISCRGTLRAGSIVRAAAWSGLYDEKRNAMRTTTLLLCTTVLLGGCNATENGGEGVKIDEAALVLSLPATVPSNYVATPNGYFDPACVVEVDDDETIGSDGQIVSSAGTVRAIAPCLSPRYDGAGNVIDEATGLAAQNNAVTPNAGLINGYIEYAESEAIGPVSYLHAQWNVPAAPANKSNQIDYYFPALIHSGANPHAILQPVLGWNQLGQSGWTLADWNCCIAGTTYHSKTSIKATQSGTVSGDISGTGCSSSTGICSSWEITALDWKSEISVAFHTTTPGYSQGEVMGGALEVYNVTVCGMIPTTTVKYSGIYINNIHGTHVTTPSWNTVLTPGLNPQCGYSVTYPGGGDIELHE
jgi:hypothetical protein